MGLCIPKFQPPDSIPPPTEADFRKRGTKYTKSVDGRFIEYSVYGSSAPDAKIVINAYYAWFTPPAFQQKLLTLNIRYIDIAIPGLGYSQINPALRHHLWPKTDCEPVLAAEGISTDTKLYVWGQSAGTQYAMAMAQHFGAERVVKLGLRAPYLPKPLSQELMLPDGQPTITTLKDLEPPGSFAARYMVCSERCSYGCMKLAVNHCWCCVKPQCATPEKMQCTEAQMKKKALEAFNSYQQPHDYQGFMYFMSKEVLLNDVGPTEDRGLDVRRLRDDGFVGGDKVLVWWAEDDEDTGGVHPPWIVEHLQAESRMFTKAEGMMHDGATDAYHEDFLEALVRPAGDTQAPKPVTMGAWSE